MFYNQENLRGLIPCLLNFYLLTEKELISVEIISVSKEWVHLYLFRVKAVNII